MKTVIPFDFATVVCDGCACREDSRTINDKCLTELSPENEDGTTTVGMWFAPLHDDIAHKISRKFPLLRDHKETVSCAAAATPSVNKEEP